MSTPQELLTMAEDLQKQAQQMVAAEQASQAPQPVAGSAEEAFTALVAFLDGLVHNSDQAQMLNVIKSFTASLSSTPAASPAQPATPVTPASDTTVQEPPVQPV